MQACSTQSQAQQHSCLLYACCHRSCCTVFQLTRSPSQHTSAATARALLSCMCRSTRGIGSSRYALTGSNPAAGNHFSASTLIDNWSEQQSSSKYAPRNTYRLQPPDSSTEYRHHLSTAAAERQKQQRMKRLQECYLAPCRNSSRPSSAPQCNSTSATRTSMSMREHSSSGSASRPHSTSGSCHSSNAGMLLQRPQSASTWAACAASSAGSSHLTQQQQQQQHRSQGNEAGTGSRRCWSASSAAAWGAESVARTTLGRQQRLEFQDPPVGGWAASCKQLDACQCLI
jgi:hypothetical protein